MKRNNKAFSLVELIVVVLIMGIIAVALAPQVMKWVKTSRENSDTYYAKSIKSAVLTGIGEYESLGNELKDGKYNVTSNGLVAVGNDQNSGFIDVVEAIMNGDYPSVQDESGKVFQIQCWQDGKKCSVKTATGSY